MSVHPHFLCQLGGVAASAPLILRAELPGQRPDLWEVKRCQSLLAPSPRCDSFLQGWAVREAGRWPGLQGHTSHCSSAVMESSRLACELQQLQFLLRWRL